jgi:hypothetical protein
MMRRSTIWMEEPAIPGQDIDTGAVVADAVQNTRVIFVTEAF